MDPNKFYCRNAAQQSTASTSSISTATSSSISCGGTSAVPEYMGCGSGHSSGGFSCKELLPKNANSKSLLNQRGTNVTSGFGGGGSNTSGYCSSNSSGNGNYINVMPVPLGTLQYHRRKLTPQEYQSRLYYNTTDYRCRDDYYSMAGGGRLNSSSPSPSPSLQLQSQHQQQHYQPQSHPAHLTQHHHHQQSHHHQQQQQNQLQQQQQQNQTLHPINHLQYPHHPLQHHHQSVCSSNSTIHHDPVDETVNCSMMSNSGSNGRMVAATQTHHNVVANCEQEMPPTSMALGPVTVPGPPMMYTVHRVVTTAQIQTAVGNTFASSSSVSSVVSAVRNEADCMAAAASVNGGCLITGGGSGGVVGGVNIFGDVGNSVLNNNNNSNNALSGGGHATIASLRNSPGISTNTNYLQHQQKCSNTSEVQHHSGSRISNTSSSNGNYNSGTKTSSTIPRPLQNVIPTCVYLMSDVAVHMEIEGTAQCPTQVMLAAALGCEELGIANKLLAQSIFGLWMTSALLEIQLKSHHRPYVVRVAWQNLLEKFSHGNPIEKKFDEPMIMLRRNVFFSKRDEEKIKDHRILELLYQEAKHNVLSGRYIMEPVHSLMLGGIQARIEMGPYHPATHTTSFFRENQSKFLPQHVAKSSSWSWLPVSRKNSAEIKLLEQYKRVPVSAVTRKLMKKYLEFCWALPFYGAAFFHGQVEQPVRGLMSLVNHRDIEVVIAINERGIFIIDPVEFTLLLGLRYEDLSWDFAKPSASDDPECQTCIFIQFDAVENGIQISKLMQVFSKQAAMIDALISHFAEQMRIRKQDGNASEQFHDEPNPIQNNGNGVLCNKLSRLTLATFDEEGRCIGQMGSLSISY